MKFSVLLMTIGMVFSQAGWSAAPDVFYYVTSSHYGANKDEIGTIKDLNIKKTTVLVTDFHAKYPSEIEVASDAGTGNFAILTSYEGVGELNFKKKGHFCAYGNVKTGLEGFIAAGSDWGKFELRPFFSKDGSKLFSYGLFMYVTSMNIYDIGTKKFSKYFYNKWPKMFKGKGSDMLIGTTLADDEKRVAFIYGDSGNGSIYVAFQEKDPIKILSSKKILDKELAFFGDTIFYYEFQDMKDFIKKFTLCAVDVKTQKTKKVFEYSMSEGKYSAYPLPPMVYDPVNNVVFFRDAPNKGSDELSDIYVLDMETMETELLIENTLGLYAVSADGKYLLYGARVDPDAKFSYPSENDPECIGIYDLQSGKTKQLKVPGAVKFEYLNFVEK
ncbi:MAG: hypothetical protein A2014_11255 [Spirochaetes bacterium GWF1_49_6]|nr:MAG: hypothetical protein A2014_11255 [Spirochaetes bacterium GWF1_49_6]